MKKLLAPVTVSILAGLISACSNTAPVQTAAALPQASALLAPTQGNTAQGTVLFKQEADGNVRIIAEVSGLTPGLHGFHVHEKGDCSAPDASSAGGHFNPHQTPHGKAGEGTHHVGDLPSLEADANGNAALNAVLNSLTLTGDDGIIGRGMIVHANPDDYSQPVGNAGPRVACAVIQKD